MKLGAATLVVFPIVIASCSGEPAARASSHLSPEIRDSAGVEIIVNAQDERALTLQPVLRVGVVDGNTDLQFDAIRSLAIDSTGGFWVVDRNPGIRHYDGSGHYVGSVGAAGQGPGEAKGYGNIILAGGRVLAWGFPSILQLFDADGTFLDSRVPYSARGSVVLPLGFTQGRWIFKHEDFDKPATGAFRRNVHIVAAADLSSDTLAHTSTAVAVHGSGTDTIGIFKGQLSIRDFLPNHVSRVSWFHGNPSFALDASGHLFVSDTSAYRIDVYDLTGAHVRAVQRFQPPRAYDPTWKTEIEKGLTEVLRHNDQPVNRAELARLMQNAIPTNPPAALPFIQKVLAAPNGAIWIERADRHPRPAYQAVAHAMGWVRHDWRPEWIVPRVYDIFDSVGGYRGTVNVPGTFEPMAVTADRVYGVSYDAMGVEFVVAYQLTDSRS